MLVLYRSPHVRVSHRPHHCCEVAGVGKHASSIIVPGTIQDEILRQLSLPPSKPELLANIRQMATLRWRRPDHSSESLFFPPASYCRAQR
jgi:hypothetical protein